MLRLLLELILQTHLEALLHFVSLFLITLAFFGQVQLPYLNLRTPQNCNFRCQVIYLGSILFLFLIGGVWCSIVFPYKRFCDSFFFEEIRLLRIFS